MRIIRTSAAATVLLGTLWCCSGCPGDDDDASGDAGSNVVHVPRPETDIVPCPEDTPDFVVGEEDGLSADSERGMYKVRLIDAAPEEPVIKGDNDWTIQISDAEGNPVDVGIAAACAFMPVHNHGIPPYDPIEKLDQPGQYKLKRLFFKMHGPWEVQLAIDPAEPDAGPVSYTSCEVKAMTRNHPGRDFAILNLCLDAK